MLFHQSGRPDKGTSPTSRNFQRPPARASRATCRLQLECLEERNLLSATVLDPTFGSGGKVLTQLAGVLPTSAHAVAVQADHKIVVVGAGGSASAYGFTLARYTPGGTLDAGFGNGGTVLTPFPGSDPISQDGASAVAFQADGKIVVAGTATTNLHSYFALARYNVNGTLDRTFGAGGKVTNDVAPQIGNPDVGGIYDPQNSAASGVVVQKDGKIVVVGWAGSFSHGGFAVVRYNANGSLDHTFGTDGTVRTNFGFHYSQAHAVALQGDGKIVVVGDSYLEDSQVFTAARYNGNGSLDSHFGTGGKITTAVGGLGIYSTAHAVTLQADGKIVVAGDSFDHVALVRYNRDGSLDSHFGSAGQVVVRFGLSRETAGGVAVLADGSIVVGGGSADLSSSPAFLLARYTPDGKLDKRFGAGGSVVTHFGSAGRLTTFAPGFALQANGQVVMAATVGAPAKEGFEVARYTANGSPDAAWHGTGKVVTAFSGPVDIWAAAVALQPDGKVVVAGGSSSGDTVLARYTSPGRLDATFGKGGIVTSSLGSASGVQVLAGGKLLVFGLGGLARYNRDGSPDTGFGSGGQVTSAFGSFGNGVAPGVVVLASGKILVVGSFWTGSGFDILLIRYNVNGSLDTNFGTGGKVLTNLGSGWAAVSAIAVQPDGKIVVAGSSMPPQNPFEDDFVLLRYQDNGSPDTTFGVGGRVHPPLAPNHRAGSGILLQTDGKIVVAVASQPFFPGPATFALARFTTKGNLDTGFGSGGKVVTDLAEEQNEAPLLAVRAGGKIVVVGSTVAPGGAGSPSPFTLEQFNSDGRPDLSFGPGGKRSNALGGSRGTAAAVAVQADGKLLVAGTTPGASGVNDFVLARILSK